MINRNQKETAASRAKAKKEYGKLFDAVSGILFQHDPAGVNFDFNKDEYDIEAGTILPRLKNCRSEEDVLIVIREELQKWFDDETAAREQNKEIAKELWDLWRNREF